MAAKIGILGETVVTTVGETTVYTVPADKAARGRLVFVIQGGAGGWQALFRIGSPGSEIHIEVAAASGYDAYTGMKINRVPFDGADPGGYHALDAGIVDNENTVDVTSATGVDRIGAPYAVDWFLSTGDTVRLDLRNTAAVDLLVQFVGVEDDA